MIDGSQFGFVGMNMKRYRLGEICEIVSGSTPKTSIQEYWDGDIKWITPAEITDDSYIITDTVRKITKLGVEKNGLSSFPAGTVILSSRAPIGKVAIAGCDMYCNQGFKNLICSKIINNKYLYWFLKGKKDYLNKLGRGATFKEISKQIVAEIEIELPSLEEQVLVANNLLNIKRVIDLKKKEIDLFDKLIKARFVEMFGDVYVNSKSWPIHRFSQHIKFLTSGSRGWAKYFTNAGEYFITIKNVKNCQISLNNVQHIAPPDNAEAERTKVKEGDLLISITADLGRTGVVSKEIANHGAYINQHLTCIRIDQTVLHPLYAAYFMESEAGKKQFQAKNQSAVKAGLNFDSINSLQIAVPPLSLQKEFVCFVTQIDKSKVVYLKAARKYHKQSKVVEMKMSQC